jgi:hypothetical protein
MFDLELGSLALEELGFLLVALVACIVAVVLIGVDGIIVAVAMRYAIAIFAVLARRAWRRIRSRICEP